MEVSHHNTRHTKTCDPPATCTKTYRLYKTYTTYGYSIRACGSTTKLNWAKNFLPFVLKMCCPWLLGHTVPWLCTNYTTLYQKYHLHAKCTILSGHSVPIGVNFTGLEVYERQQASYTCESLFSFLLFMNFCLCVLTLHISRHVTKSNVIFFLQQKYLMLQFNIQMCDFSIINISYAWFRHHSMALRSGKDSG